METFCILKSKYLDTKLRFLNALEKYRQYADVEEKEDSTPREIQLNKRFSDECWETYISVINAASMMLNYVADCSMDKVEDSSNMCYIVGVDMIENQANPAFPFMFKFLALPSLESIMKKRPSLEGLCDEIKFRNITMDALVRELDEANIPHGEVVELVEFPDNYFLRRPFLDWVQDLADYAESCISEFDHNTW